MYYVTLYDQFNTEIIKTFENESETLVEAMFECWLKDDACDGETLKMYDREQTIKEIKVKKKADTTKKVTITMTDKTKKRALNLSVIELGSSNISGYITYLINKAHLEANL